MAVPPSGDVALLVTAERCHVQVPKGPHELLDSAVLGGVCAVHDAIFLREVAHPITLWRGNVDVLEVVLGTVALLLRGARGSVRFSGAERRRSHTPGWPIWVSSIEATPDSLPGACWPTFAH